nr:ergothioneine biosynthesis glutamate--cysteine ligase EgtA [Rhizohabitans arisaemae]
MTEDDVVVYAGGCFRPSGADRVGVELEWLVYDPAAPREAVPIERVRSALAGVPLTSRVTFEPGGQLELSSPTAALLPCLLDLARDLGSVRCALADAGLVLVGSGIDPIRTPSRQVTGPRYDAMARFLGSPFGPLMMCSTASVQVNLDFGPSCGTAWERAHRLGPVLLASFANSAVLTGRPSGWMSARQAVWAGLDRTRTDPVPLTDPVEAWARYLLDARLMLVRECADGPGEVFRPVSNGATFGDWLRDGAGLDRPPTPDDLAYHATTVFPPVRPRGWLEIRYLDAQQPWNWPVCAAVTYALICDDRAAEAAMAAAEPLAGAWRTAARRSIADPLLRRAARTCFRAALEALPGLGADRRLVAAVSDFAETYIDPGRPPAVDFLDLIDLDQEEVRA